MPACIDLRPSVPLARVCIDRTGRLPGPGVLRGYRLQRRVRRPVRKTHDRAFLHLVVDYTHDSFWTHTDCGSLQVRWDLQVPDRQLPVCQCRHLRASGRATGPAAAGSTVHRLQPTPDDDVHQMCHRLHGMRDQHHHHISRPVHATCRGHSGGFDTKHLRGGRGRGRMHRRRQSRRQRRCRARWRLPGQRGLPLDAHVLFTVPDAQLRDLRNGIELRLRELLCSCLVLCHWHSYLVQILG